MRAMGDSSLGIPQNVAAGLNLMRNSLSTPHPSAHRMGIYGFMLATSSSHAADKRGVEDGVKWIRRGANADSATSMAELGSLYTFGALGVKQNTAKAAYWLRKSAKLGNAVAQEEFGVLQLTRSKAKSAVHWLNAAAEKGNVTAQGTLAALLVSGKFHVRAKPHEGVMWAERAISKQSAYGYYALGFAYQQGVGGKPEDPADAWYNFALAKRFDTTHQLTHVDQHLSAVAGHLPATELSELKAKVSAVPLPKNKRQY